MDEAEKVQISPDSVDVEESEENQKPEMELQVSTDNMAAYLRVQPAKNGNRAVTYEEVIDFLHEHGIVFGILEDSIHDFCDNKKFYLELTCARGIDPIDQNDGKLEYLVRIDQTIAPKQKEDGTVDFRDLGLVQNVSKGDVLCRLIPPEGGEDGTDIYQHSVSFHVGRTPKFPSGKNTEITEDGLALISSIDGCVEYKNANLNINDAFIVHGDVSSESGNIDFSGTVTVQGDVLEGFSVRAGQDLIIRGMVEGATLKAGGNITIANGMHGMGKGIIHAEGNVTGKFFENVTIISGSDVYADVILNSNVTASGTISLKGKNALLAGGKCVAGKKITANVIGSNSNTRTDVCIESKDLTRLLTESGNTEEESMKARLVGLKDNAEKLKAQISAATKSLMTSSNVGRDKAALRENIRQKSAVDTQIHELEQKISEIEKQSKSTVDFSIIGLKTIFAGTKLKIGDFSQLLTNDYSNMKFYSDREHIVSGPVLPSDR